MNDLPAVELQAEDDLAALQSRYGSRPQIRADLEVGAEFYQQWHRRLAETRNRRAEVVLVLLNPQERILLHTKSFYPPGIFRLPTGGVKPHEDLMDALPRETFEETGYRDLDYNYLGATRYVFNLRDRALPFTSFNFSANLPDGRPRIQDHGERISGFSWITKPELSRIAGSLRDLSENWHDWGRMRAVSHEAVLVMLERS